MDIRVKIFGETFFFLSFLKHLTVTNSFHCTAQWDLNDANNPVPYFTHLSTNYAFAQLHFHWGSQDDKGSEHTINGVHFPLEMHMVHYDANCADLDTCLDKPGGLAINGFLFDIANESTGALRVALTFFMSNVILP